MSDAPEVNDAVTVPRFQVNLDESKASRWNHIILVYKDQLQAVEAQMAELTEKHAPTYAAIGETMLSGASKTGLVYYGDEIGGIAKASGISTGRLTAMQLIYEAAATCTSVTFQHSNNSGKGPGGASSFAGAPAHARNMDWEMEFLRPLTIEVEFVKGGRPLCIATTWVGYVGVLTGMALRPSSITPSAKAAPAPTAGGGGGDGAPMGEAPPGANATPAPGCYSPSENHFSVSVNYRVTSEGTYWQNVKKTLGRAWPIGFLLREVLMTADYHTAVAQLRNSSLIAPTYLTICGGLPGQGLLITRNREGESNPQQIDYVPTPVPVPVAKTATAGGMTGGDDDDEEPTFRLGSADFMEPEAEAPGVAPGTTSEAQDAVVSQLKPEVVPGLSTGTGPTQVRANKGEPGFKQVLVARDNTVVCNMDHWETDPKKNVFMSRRRVNAAQVALEKLRAKTTVTTDDLWGLLSVSPVFNEITIYGTVMVPALGYYQTRLPKEQPIGFHANIQGSKKFAKKDSGVHVVKCTFCDQVFDPALNSKGQCVHKGTWHEVAADCSWLKCGYGLGFANSGKQHWGCCFSFGEERGLQEVGASLRRRTRAG